MPPKHLHALLEKNGTLEKQVAGQVFHTQDFMGMMFLVKKGYVKRYQITKDGSRIIELIYGPGHIFPLTHLYQKVFAVQPNQDHLIYIYEAMTDAELWRLPETEVEAALETDTHLYIDLYYESGIRLKANIDRLASNAIVDDYQKIAHQLICLSDDFGNLSTADTPHDIHIDVPLKAADMAEQLNISTAVAEAVLNNLIDRKLITVNDDCIRIPDANLLKDVYL